MNPSIISRISEDFDRIRELSPPGFVLALNVRWRGPEYLHSEFPEEWREIYESKNYFMFDPIYYWTMINTGRVRWSEVGLPDPHKISQKAAGHGLSYGATFCQKLDGTKSFLSTAHSEREFTIGEMDDSIIPIGPPAPGQSGRE